MGKSPDRWVIATLALLLAVGAGLAGVMAGSAARGSFSAEGSTYRSAPDGARGLYLLAEHAGLAVTRRHLDLEVIGDEAEVLVLLGVHGGGSCESVRPHAGESDAGDEERDENGVEHEEEEKGRGRPVPFVGWLRADGGLSALECQTVREWIFEGGRLLHVTHRHDALLSAIGLRFEKATAGESDTTSLVPGQPSALVAGVERALAPVAGFVSAGDGDEVVLLETEKDHRAVAVARDHGSGKVVVVAAPALATNRWLGEKDNAVFLTSLLKELSRGGPIGFVEHHHGHADERSIMGYLLKKGLGATILQICLVLAVGIAAARRLGRPLSSPPERTRSGGDHMSAMSRIYKLGEHHGHAGERIAARAMEYGSRLQGDPNVAAATESLLGARRRLRKRSEMGEANDTDVWEVARRAAAVYDAVVRRRDGAGAG